jgi:hypothetical protein
MVLSYLYILLLFRTILNKENNAVLESSKTVCGEARDF